MLVRDRLARAARARSPSLVENVLGRRLAGDLADALVQLLRGVDHHLLQALLSISATVPSTSVMIACPFGFRASNSSTTRRRPRDLLLQHLQHRLDRLRRAPARRSPPRRSRCPRSMSS